MSEIKHHTYAVSTLFLISNISNTLIPVNLLTNAALSKGDYYNQYFTVTKLNCPPFYTGPLAVTGVFQ